LEKRNESTCGCALCGARDRDKGSDTLSATVGGPWLSIRRESTQGAVQLQHVAVGPGSGDPRSKMIGLGRFRGRDDQGTNTRKWCKFSRGLGSGWGGRDKRHLSLHCAWKTPITPGGSGTLDGCQGCLYQPFFHRTQQHVQKSSGYARSLTVWWSRGLGPRTNKVWGSMLRDALATAQNLPWPPLYAQFVTSTLDTKLRIDKG
jgi:hypothetical protein